MNRQDDERQHDDGGGAAQTLPERLAGRARTWRARAHRKGRAAPIPHTADPSINNDITAPTIDRRAEFTVAASDAGNGLPATPASGALCCRGNIWTLKDDEDDADDPRR